MKFGLFAINFSTCADPDVAVRVAQHAEAAGFESVWTGEHLVLPSPRVEASPLPPTTPMLDTIVALTLIAAHTTTIRVGSGIIVLPQRHPVVLAKELASVDVVSHGRLIVGVGVGYLEPEFAALGVAMEQRGPRMDDSIRAMRALWTMDQPRYHGEFVSFNDIDAHPRPVQQPCPPIVIGGGSWPAIRRAVTMGNGWYGFGTDLALAAECTDGLRTTAARHERPAELGTLEITITPAGPLDAAIVDQYAELGVDRLVLLPQPDASRDQRHAPVALATILRNIDRVADTIVNR